MGDENELREMMMLLRHLVSLLSLFLVVTSLTLSLSLSLPLSLSLSLSLFSAGWSIILSPQHLRCRQTRQEVICFKLRYPPALQWFTPNSHSSSSSQLPPLDPPSHVMTAMKKR
jgi:hypothetical protein